MTKCMVCGDEFDPQYKAQRLCQSCLDKFTKRYWDWNAYRKQGYTRRPTRIVCDKPMKTRDMIAGVAIVIFWTLYTKYKWRDKRIKDLQYYYKDPRRSADLGIHEMPQCRVQYRLPGTGSLREAKRASRYIPRQPWSKITIIN